MVTGVTSANGPVRITITSIRQDEPVDGNDEDACGGGQDQRSPDARRRARLNHPADEGHGGEGACEDRKGGSGDDSKLRERWKESGTDEGSDHDNGSGSGNTCPDGKGVGSSTASIRAERDGNGDGRVYHIGFTATDEDEQSCSGEVLVCVPHDRGDRMECVDEGPLYDSTKCPDDSSPHREHPEK
jgi:hypothetical protein